MDKQFNGLPAKKLDYEHMLVAASMHRIGSRSGARVVHERAERSGYDPASGVQSVIEPLPAAGVSSTATPEFCVNVTEIQLFSHDTKADVGLSLVNRTGHRLFITLIGLTSLTDSSGRKWNTGDSKGLGGPNNPVPLEPDGETQGAISFYQNGQSPIDLTFSLRGEIGIMKMDSRGQAVPGQIALKRADQPLGDSYPATATSVYWRYGTEQGHQACPIVSSAR